MSAVSELPGRLSADEIETLGNLLRRYCSPELDQWELLRVETPHGDVCVGLSRELPPGHTADVYVELDAWRRGHP